MATPYCQKGEAQLAKEKFEAAVQTFNHGVELDKSHPGWDGFAGWGGRLPGVSAQRDFLLSAQFVPALYFGTDQVRVAATTPWLRGNLPRYSRLKR